MLLPLCLASLALAASSAELSDTPHPSFALHVTVASLPLSGSALGIGGLTSSDSLRAGLTAEVRFGRHWTGSLGTDLGFSTAAQTLAQQVAVTATPGLRWYARDAFDGPVLALELPVTWTRIRSLSVDASGGVQAFELSGLDASATLLAGWVFAWDNGLLVSCAAGPEVTLRRTSFNGASELSTTSVALRVQLGAGVRF